MIQFKGWIKVEDLNHEQYCKYLDYEEFLNKRDYYEYYNRLVENYNKALPESKQQYKDQMEELDNKMINDINELVRNRQFVNIYIPASKYEDYKIKYARKYPQSKIGKEYRQKMAGLFLV